MSDSSKTDEQEYSDNDSIPDLNKTLDEQGMITMIEFTITNFFKYDLSTKRIKCVYYYIFILLYLYLYIMNTYINICKNGHK